MAIIDRTISMVGHLSSTVELHHFVNSEIAIAGSLDAEVGIQNLQTLAPLSMEGSLSSTIITQNLQNISIEMKGTLDAEFNALSCITCNDFFIDFEPEIIYSKGCAMARKRSTEYKRTRGDTYPVPAILAIKGNYDISGMASIKMSTQIDNGTIYTVNATILDDSTGSVEFPLTALAVAVAGSGTYDIQGDTGTYIHTYQSGRFVLEDDLTV